MNFIHPNNKLATAMIHHMQPHIESGHMLSLTVEDIMRDLSAWFAGIGQDESLTGFFCIRHPHADFAEMGSVRSLKGILPNMVQHFEQQRQLANIPQGCAITKNHPQKFVQLTQGRIMQTFPPWYQRAQSDKHFVQWS